MHRCKDFAECLRRLLGKAVTIEMASADLQGHETPARVGEVRVFCVPCVYPCVCVRAGVPMPTCVCLLCACTACVDGEVCECIDSSPLTGSDKLSTVKQILTH